MKKFLSILLMLTMLFSMPQLVPAEETGDTKADSIRFVDADDNVIINADDIIRYTAKYDIINSAGTQKEYHLELKLTDTGSQKFKEATKRIAELSAERKNFISIYVQNECISRPVVTEEIVSDTIIITGNFTYENVKALETMFYKALQGDADLAAPAGWARDDIRQAESIGMTADFKAPWAQAITREQFCTLVYNMLDTAMDIAWKKAGPNPFSDTDNEKVISLFLEKIIEGKGDWKFAPEEALTREEAATILVRIADYAEVENNSPSEADMAYADDADISEWAREAVYKLYGLGIMQGTEQGFEPKASYTAEQSVTTLMRLYRWIAMNDESSALPFADRLNSQMPSDQNYVFSPLSIKMALVMAANGAEGATKQEILDAVGVDVLESYNRDVERMLKNYSQADLLRLNVSNSIWINTDLTSQKFASSYENKVKEVFGGTSDTVNRQTAFSKINGWVNEKTGGKIPAIISEDNTDFWAMLVNAVYFKGRWMYEFNKELTKEEIFTDRNGKDSAIDFMNKRGWVRYAENGGIQMIEMPYLNFEDIVDERGEYVETERLDGMNMSMFLMIADSEFNPETVLNSAEFSSTYMNLSIPKFNIDYSVGLKDALRHIGIRKAFTKNAEFSNMFDSGNMWITDALHKTYIKVDEEGTEAAAITPLELCGSPLPPEPITVRFNRPFTFIIRDNINDEILFVGEYAFADS